jgi:hypothetical protein
MNSLLNFLKSLLSRSEPRRDADEAYLADAVDLYDLERRMRTLDQRHRGVLVGLDVVGLTPR